MAEQVTLKQWKRVPKDEALERDVFLVCNTDNWKWSFVSRGRVLQECKGTDVKHPADATWSFVQVRRVNL